MSEIIPITLTQENLGERHREFNFIVKAAYENDVTFLDLHLELHIKSPVDRIFKIDYASKYKDVDYILINIKDEDMLYVSRALKSTWLLETQYQHIICPSYLENVLYPDMITPAVSKMKNWLYLHLKNQGRCQQFYLFYCTTKFNYAVKFLSHCSTNFIVNEASKVMDKLTPYTFKKLCESCPHVAKIFFDSLPDNDTIKSNFLANHVDYYDSLKVVLKTEPEIFFDITENILNGSLADLLLNT